MLYDAQTARVQGPGRARIRPRAKQRHKVEMNVESEGRRVTELGPLEAAVMDTLWQTQDALDVEAVHARVAPQGRPVRNTVQSTLERLVRKGLVRRSKHGRAYHYTARVGRRDWFAGAVDALAEALRSRSSPELLAGFVDFAERADPEALETLQRLVHERLDDRTPPGENEDGTPSDGETGA